MCIKVSSNQNRLKEKHGSRPDRRRAANVWQNNPREQWLNKKQQRCTGEDCDSEQDRRESRIRLGKRRAKIGCHGVSLTFEFSNQCAKEYVVSLA